MPRRAAGRGAAILTMLVCMCAAARYYDWRALGDARHPANRRAALHQHAAGGQAAQDGSAAAAAAADPSRISWLRHRPGALPAAAEGDRGYTFILTTVLIFASSVCTVFRVAAKLRKCADVVAAVSVVGHVAEIVVLGARHWAMAWFVQVCLSPAHVVVVWGLRYLWRALATCLNPFNVLEKLGICDPLAQKLPAAPPAFWPSAGNLLMDFGVCNETPGASPGDQLFGKHSPEARMEYQGFLHDVVGPARGQSFIACGDSFLAARATATAGDQLYSMKMLSLGVALLAFAGVSSMKSGCCTRRFCSVRRGRFKGYKLLRYMFLLHAFYFRSYLRQVWPGHGLVVRLNDWELFRASDAPVAVYFAIIGLAKCRTGGRCCRTRRGPKALRGMLYTLIAYWLQWYWDSLGAQRFPAVSANLTAGGNSTDTVIVDHSLTAYMAWWGSQWAYLAKVGIFAAFTVTAWWGVMASLISQAHFAFERCQLANDTRSKWRKAIGCACLAAAMFVDILLIARTGRSPDTDSYGFVRFGPDEGWITSWKGWRRIVFFLWTLLGFFAAVMLNGCALNNSRRTARIAAFAREWVARPLQRLLIARHQVIVRAISVRSVPVVSAATSLALGALQRVAADRPAEAFTAVPDWRDREGRDLFDPDIAALALCAMTVCGFLTNGDAYLQFSVGLASIGLLVRLNPTIRSAHYVVGDHLCHITAPTMGMLLLAVLFPIEWAAQAFRGICVCLGLPFVLGRMACAHCRRGTNSRDTAEAVAVASSSAASASGSVGSNDKNMERFENMLAETKAAAPNSRPAPSPPQLLRSRSVPLSTDVAGSGGLPEAVQRGKRLLAEAAPKRECCVCYNEVSEMLGVVCRRDETYAKSIGLAVHFTCDECLSLHAMAEFPEDRPVCTDLAARGRGDGGLYCPCHPGTPSAPTIRTPSDGPDRRRGETKQEQEAREEKIHDDHGESKRSSRGSWLSKWRQGEGESKGESKFHAESDDTCSAPPFDVTLLASHLNPAAFKRCLAVQRYCGEQRVFEDTTAKWTVRYDKALTQLREQKIREDRSIFAEQLRRQFPNARQCGNCGHGPILHKWCNNLSTHHNQRVGNSTINNACPKCEWFRPKIQDWPRWDGKLADDVDVSSVSAFETNQKKREGLPTASETAAQRHRRTTRHRADEARAAADAAMTAVQALRRAARQRRDGLTPDLRQLVRQRLLTRAQAVAMMAEDQAQAGGPGRDGPNDEDAERDAVANAARLRVEALALEQDAVAAAAAAEAEEERERLGLAVDELPVYTFPTGNEEAEQEAGAEAESGGGADGGAARAPLVLRFHEFSMVVLMLAAALACRALSRRFLAYFESASYAAKAAQLGAFLMVLAYADAARRHRRVYGRGQRIPAPPPN